MFGYESARSSTYKTFVLAAGYRYIGFFDLDIRGLKNMDILKFQELVWYLNLFLHIPGSSIPCGESFQRQGGAAFKCNTTKMSVELLVHVLSFRYPILLASEQGTFHCFL